MSVGKNIKHDSAKTHVTGKSQFVDDRPFLSNELIVDYFGSPCPHGEILSLDISAARNVPGVVAIYTAKDLANNKWGTIVHDQPVLADKIFSHADEPICLIAGETKEAIKKAKALIKLQYTELDPILNIDKSIEKNLFLYTAVPFVKGDAEKAINFSTHKHSGFIEIGGQEHFYLESQASIAYPQEDGSIEIHSSSQHPTETQHVVSEAIGIQQNKITCIVRRMGGGFGGKESQAAPFAAMAALVTNKTNRPARIVLSKDDDMKTTGKRHPFKIYYTVGFDDSGKINSLIAKLYADAGAYTDLSPSILERAMFHIDGVYYLENAKIEAWACKTNYSSNTAFRGFGGPQGTFAIESIIEDISSILKKPAEEIRQINLYQNKNIETPYGQILEHNPIPELYNKILISSDLKKRRNQIKEFNTKQTNKVRGLSITGVKFGIAFTARFLNQGNALVIIHRDGTLQISTGATEMGQGVNTKILQIASSTLGITDERIKIMPTATDKNANTSPTAASSGSDINGAATHKACLELKRRLAWVAYNYFNKTIPNMPSELSIPPKEFLIENTDLVFTNNKIESKKFNSHVTLNEIINIAYLNRLSLSEYSHFKTENLGFDKNTGKGRAFNYFTNGFAVSEVEIDSFTGETKVLRVDILMDLGRLINPEIDRGQVTGAFIQGMGWVTTEALYYNNGHLISHSPTTYKIPNIQDTPRIFNIDFIDNPNNTHNIYGSKAVGEPPFLLGISIWTAIKNALSYRSKGSIVNIKSPATNEVILMELNKYV